MEIVHLNTFATRGGAAIAAMRLHRALRELDQDSRMLVAEDVVADGVETVAGKWQRVLGKFVALPQRRHRPLTDDRGRYVGLERRIGRPDILHLHWVSHLFDYGSFFSSLPPELPVVWTLHDSNPLTGGCHTPMDCRRFEQSCGDCPLIANPGPEDASRQIWTRKKTSYETLRGQLTLVSPSRWLLERARSASLLSWAPIHHIPNGLDVEMFAPGSREEARRKLSLPQHARIVLFVAHSLDNPLKGFADVKEAVERQSEATLLVSCGRGGLSETSRHRHLGVREEGKMVELYIASDVLAMGSKTENFPNVVSEALACGTPVVAYDVGGIPEMIDESVGRLAPVDSIERLTEALREVLELGKRSFGDACRAHAIEKFSADDRAQNYLELYRECVARSKAGE